VWSSFLLEHEEAGVRSFPNESRFPVRELFELVRGVPVLGATPRSSLSSAAATDKSGRSTLEKPKDGVSGLEFLPSKASRAYRRESSGAEDLSSSGRAIPMISADARRLERDDCRW
jgi:hypothetical protein